MFVFRNCIRPKNTLFSTILKRIIPDSEKPNISSSSFKQSEFNASSISIPPFPLASQAFRIVWRPCSEKRKIIYQYIPFQSNFGNYQQGRKIRLLPSKEAVKSKFPFSSWIFLNSNESQNYILMFETRGSFIEIN